MKINFIWQFDFELVSGELESNGDVDAYYVVDWGKQEIVEIAQRIGTFETSILPYEDCCTIFVPKHPETKPKREMIEKSEIEMEKIAGPMIEKAIADAEIVRV